jgi:hypothetical protein
MLAATLFELHNWGGIPFMIPIDLIAIFNLVIIGYVLFRLISTQSLLSKPLELLKHLGGFAMAWGAFGTLVGLFAAFNSLEALAEPLPVNVIYGGLKVSLITFLYGTLVYLISLLAYIIFKATEKISQ